MAIYFSEFSFNIKLPHKILKKQKMINTIINYNISKVNSQSNIFPYYVEGYEEEPQIKYTAKSTKATCQAQLDFDLSFYPLKKLVPSSLQNYVLHIIKTQFKNDPKAYIATVSLFFEKFTKKDKHICENTAEGKTKLATKQLKRKRKATLLWAAQLLKLMGGKDKFKRASILCNDLTNLYKEEMKKTDEFIAQHRLVRANGKVIKLASLSDKQKQKIAQILKISSTLCELAKRKNYTYSLVTLTLPPVFNSNPVVSDKCSYGGARPEEAHKQLMHFWKLIRSYLAKAGFKVGDDFFGLQTVECMKSSTLHLHSLIYSSPKFNEEQYYKNNRFVTETEILHKVIKSVQNNYNAQFPIDGVNDEVRENNKKYRVKFDIKLNDGRASGATYVFKYITKTYSAYDSEDKSALKNTACRSMYGARGFAFFGIRNCLTQFNFLVSNYKTFKDYVCEELQQILETGDYLGYIDHYYQFFENVHYEDNGEKKLLGVTFDTRGNDYIKTTTLLQSSAYTKEVLLIEKKQYCVFELAQDQDPEITTIDALDLKEICNMGASYAFELVKAKQETYDTEKLDFINNCNMNSVCVIHSYETDTNTTRLAENKKQSPEQNSLRLHLKNLVQVTPVLTDNLLIEKPKISVDFEKTEEKFNTFNKYNFPITI